MSSSRLDHGSASCFFISPPGFVFVNGSRLIRRSRDNRVEKNVFSPASSLLFSFELKTFHSSSRGFLTASSRGSRNFGQRIVQRFVHTQWPRGTSSDSLLKVVKKNEKSLITFQGEFWICGRLEMNFEINITLYGLDSGVNFGFGDGQKWRLKTGSGIQERYEELKGLKDNQIIKFLGLVRGLKLG